MIRTMYAEAASQGTDGMAAVAHVILNRTADKRFPNTPGKVSKQDKQFSAWNAPSQGGNNLINIDKSSAEYKATEKILSDVLSGKLKDNTEGATLLEPRCAKN